MNFDFLFQHFEGVLGVIRRKAKVLAVLSLAGILSSVVLTIVFALGIDSSRHIPGVMVLGIMMVLTIVSMMHGNYKAAVRVVYALPLALYFLFINDFYALLSGTGAINGILICSYLVMLALIVFSYSLYVFLYFFLEMAGVLVYALYVKGLLADAGFWDYAAIFAEWSPFIELALVAAFTAGIFWFYQQMLQSSNTEIQHQRAFSNELFRQFEDGILVLEMQRDERGEKSGMIVRKANAGFRKNFRVDKDELFLCDYSEVFPKIFRNSFNWQEVYFHAGKSRVEVNFQHLGKWFLINNLYPEPDVTVSFFLDITRLKHEAIRLRDREQRLTRLMGSLPDIFFIIEHDGTYIDYVSNNPELMELSQKDIIGKTIFEMGFSSTMAYQIYSSIQHVLDNDNIETIEYGMELASGGSLVFEMRLAKLNRTQVISIGRDITSKKEHEQELLAAKRKTEEASRLKDAFLENISHEMRTPMNAILGFSSMLNESCYTEEQKQKFVEIIMQNGDNLMQIVTNVIDISEIESGNMGIKLLPCDVREICLRLYQKYNEQINSMGKDIEIRLLASGDEKEVMMTSDKHLLDKVLSHLLDNAVKFTDSGLITLGYTLYESEIAFYVEDTGIGIPSEKSELIFQLFEQADNRINRRYAGTGAGLTIARNLIRLLGGNMNFESEPGKGSRFHFILPLNNRSLS